MATVTTKTYPTMDMTEFITDITNIYDWVQVEPQIQMPQNFTLTLTNTFA